MDNNKIIDRIAAEAENMSVPCGEARKVSGLEDDRHWEGIQRFLQESALVIDYLHSRVVCKRNGEPEKLSPLYAQVADADGELTDELIVEQLNAIARQAAAGFVAGDGFPVFGPLL